MVFSPSPSFKLLKIALDTAEKTGVEYTAGQLFTSSGFYAYDGLKALNLFADLGCLAVEMEAYALYAIASEQKKHALAIVTISDMVPVEGIDSSKHKNLTAEERQTSLNDMVTLALESAIQF